MATQFRIWLVLVMCFVTGCQHFVREENKREEHDALQNQRDSLATMVRTLEQTHQALMQMSAMQQELINAQRELARTLKSHTIVLRAYMDAVTVQCRILLQEADIDGLDVRSLMSLRKYTPDCAAELSVEEINSLRESSRRALEDLISHAQHPEKVQEVMQVLDTFFATFLEMRRVSQE